MNPLYIVLGVVALIVVYLIALYNGLVAKRQQCNESFSGIDVQLKLRQNLVPNLIDTVKGYAAHEQETLDQVISARNSAMAANTPGEAGAAEGMLSAALGKMFALSEAYPDLKANTNFLQLQNELSQIEDKIAAARRFYNTAVGDFNTAIEQFPAVMLAGGWGFTQREFFDLGEEQREDLSVVPEVKF